jgi:hypothetical protein
LLALEIALLLREWSSVMFAFGIKHIESKSDWPCRVTRRHSPTIAERYTLTAKPHRDTAVEGNGEALRLTNSGGPPQLEGEPVKAGRLSFAPTRITYSSVADPGNANCQ